MKPVLAVLFCAVSLAIAQPVHQRMLYHNPLTGEMQHEFAAVENCQGAYTSKGWQATQAVADLNNNSRLIVRFSDRLPAAATIEFTLTRFNPAEQAVFNKSHLFFLSSEAGGASSVLYTDGSWCYLRTGKSYVRSDGSTTLRNDFSSRGLANRREVDFLTQTFNLSDLYRFKIIYNQSRVWIYINDVLRGDYPFPGQTHRFRELYFGGDPEYPSIAGPIYSDLKIYTADTEMFFEDQTHRHNLIGLGDPDFSGHGLTMGDVNGDGLTDIYIGNCMQNKCLRDVLYIQYPDGTFRDETQERGVGDECCSHGVVFVDVDNDGDLDLFNGNTWEPNQLYINDGTGYFVEQSSTRGIEVINGETRGVVAFDANNDGYIDLYAANWGMQNELYINDGHGFFVREYLGAEGAIEDVEMVGTQGVTVCDIDNDGDYEIYISKRQAPNELYLNENGRFREVAAERGIDVGARSDGATFADFDNDGDMDLFVANTKLPYGSTELFLSIFENLGNGYFADRTADYSLAMDGFTAQLFDANNDGWLDLYRLRNNSYDATAMAILSLNDGNKQFVSAGYCGVDVIGADARGCAIDDLDRDGDLDITITNKLFENIYLENHLEKQVEREQAHYLQVQVIGPQGDWGGVGSKISVYEAGHFGDRQHLLGYREATTATGYLSGNNLVQHFGLGTRTIVDIGVELVDGSAIEERNVSADQRILLQPASLRYRIEKLSGDGQSGYAGQTLNDLLSVRVVDDAGTPASSVPVNFRIVGGTGRIVGASTVESNLVGLAAVTLQLGQAPDTCVVQATVSRMIGDPVEFTVFALEAPVVLSIYSGDRQTGVVGSFLPAPCIVQVQTVLGTPAAGKNVLFEVVEGGGTVEGAGEAIAATDDEGLARAVWRLGNTAGIEQRLRASIGDAEMLFRAQAVAGLPVRIIRAGGDSQPLQPGQDFSQPFVVRVVDQNDNAVANWSVSWQVDSGEGNLAGEQQRAAVTDSKGESAVIWTAGPYLGPAQRLLAASEVNGLPLQGSPIEWFYAPVAVDAKKSIVTATGPVVADGVDVSSVVVSLRNAEGESVGAGLTVGLSVSGTANSVAMADTLTNKLGQVSASLRSTAAEQKTIRATVKGLDLQLAETTVEFLQPPQTASSLIAVSGNGQIGTAGQNLVEPLVVRVLDAMGLPMAGATVFFTVISGGGDFSRMNVLQTTSDSLGFAHAHWTMGTVAGSEQRVRVNLQNLSIPAVIFQAICRPSAIVELTKVSGDNQISAIGAMLPLPFVVRAIDAYSNPIADLDVEFVVVNGNGSFSQSDSLTVQTNPQGLASAHLRCGDQSGEIIVRATCSGLTAYFYAIAQAGFPDSQLSDLRAVSPVRPDGVEKSLIEIILRDRNGSPVAGRFVRLFATGENHVLNQPLQPTDAQGRTTGTISSTSPGEAVISAFILPDSLILVKQAVVIFDYQNLTLQMVAGNDQVAEVSTALTEPLRVRITENNSALSKSPIIFRVLSGSASIAGNDHAVQISDSLGYAKCRLTLGTRAGKVRVKVYAAVDSSKTVEFRALALPGQVSRLIKESGDIQSAAVGSILAEPLVVRLVDRFDNRVSGTSVRFSSINGGEVLNSDEIISDSLGLAACRVRLGQKSGDYYFDAKTTTGQVAVFSATALAGNSAPQIVAWQPAQLELTIQTLQPVEFGITQVADAEGDSLSYEWSINGSSVSTQPTFYLYLTTAVLQTFNLSCRVSDSWQSDLVTWTIHVLATSVADVEFMADIAEAGRGVRLQWRVPHPELLQGFSLLRSNGDGQYENLTAEVIVACHGRQDYEWFDQSASSGTAYRYVLQLIYIDGRTVQTAPVQVQAVLPTQIALLPNYPNPFNPTTFIVFDLPDEMPVDLAIYNISGQRIRTLFVGQCPAGQHRQIWDGRSDEGEIVPSGIYLYCLQTEAATLQRKLLLLK